MANRAYASFWLKDGSPAKLLFQFGRLLQTIPLSESRPRFTSLVVRAISPAETEIVERDLRPAGGTAAEILELSAEFLSSDACFEVRGSWDLWEYDMTTLEWRLGPQPVEAICRAEEYDDGAWREYGHLQLEAGLEHLFTGHARLLDAQINEIPRAGDRMEAVFDALMLQPGQRAIYREKTQANIRKLYGWAERAGTAVELARQTLWSEGEENLEARLEDLLALG